jgi:hypothetical protein
MFNDTQQPILQIPDDVIVMMKMVNKKINYRQKIQEKQSL